MSKQFLAKTGQFAKAVVQAQIQPYQDLAESAVSAWDNVGKPMKTRMLGEVDFSGPVTPERHAEARRILSFLGRLKLKETFSIVGWAGGVLDRFGVAALDLSKVIGGVANVVPQKVADSKLVMGLKKLYDTIVEFLKSLFQKVEQWWGEIVAKVKSEWLKELLGEGGELISFVVGQAVTLIAKTAADAAPAVGYVSDGLNIFTGLMRTAKNSYQLGCLEHRIKDYTVVNGVPQLIVGALERHYLARAGSGAVKAGKGVLTAGLRGGLDAGGFGTGAIAGFVISAVDSIVHLIDRVLERIALRTVLKTAYNARHSHTHSLRRDYQAFGSWFKGALVFSPVLAAVVLHSCYYDRPTEFLTVGGSARSEVLGMGSLAKHAGRYLQQHRDEYAVEFYSTHEKATGQLKAAYEFSSKGVALP